MRVERGSESKIVEEERVREICQLIRGLETVLLARASALASLTCRSDTSCVQISMTESIQH